jgi:hypothetical protein
MAPLSVGMTATGAEGATAAGIIGVEGAAIIGDMFIVNGKSKLKLKLNK